MICTEVAGMKRILVKIVLPVSLLAVWMITCYPICRKAEGFDFFLYWVLVGCPYGIRKMCMILIPKNFGIARSEEHSLNSSHPPESRMPSSA